MFCGNPQQVADQMEEWFTAPACDGFVLAAASMPGAYDGRGAAAGAGAATARPVPEGICRHHAAREPGPGDTARHRLARRAPEGLSPAPLAPAAARIAARRKRRCRAWSRSFAEAESSP